MRINQKNRGTPRSPRGVPHTNSQTAPNYFFRAWALRASSDSAGLRLLEFTLDELFKRRAADGVLTSVRCPVTMF